MGSRIFVAGDSVHWGQGLTEYHKFVYLIARRLVAVVQSAAHSGAIIGAHRRHGAKGVDGEVPFPTPTIIKQCETCLEPETVEVTIINGGINDVDVRTIINPLTNPDVLHHKIVEHCGDDMIVLLNRAAALFRHARILVTSYFPIFSHESDPLGIDRVLAAHLVQPLPSDGAFVADLGVDPAAQRIRIRNKVVELALQFWRESTEEIQRAIATSNDGPAAGRASFVEVPFQERNAMYAPAPWLFALNRRLQPQDEVVSERRQACSRVHAGDPFAAWACSIASVGHPNVAGERQYADAIVTALNAGT
jgi:hypothetical protein